MPSSITIPAQFMTPWAGSATSFDASATFLADTDSEPQRVVARFSPTQNQAVCLALLVPPGYVSNHGGILTYFAPSTGTVTWKYRGAHHPTTWLVSHGGSDFLYTTGTTDVTTSGSVIQESHTFNYLSGVTPMNWVSIELGRYNNGTSNSGSIDLLSYTWLFNDTDGSRNAYFWIPMNGVYVSQGTIPIGYYTGNGIWYRDFPSTDSSIDFQVTVPSDAFDFTHLYLRFQANSSESAGASGCIEVYTSISNPCVDYDQDFEYAGSGSLRSDNGTGTPTYWVAILLSPDIQAGDQVTFRIKRLGDDSRDTFTGTYRLMGMYLRYEKSSFTQSDIIPLTNVLGTADNLLVPTVESTSYHWVGRYSPGVTTYLDLPINSIKSNYLSSPVLKIRWITRNNLTGRVLWKVSLGNAPYNQPFSYSSEYSKSSVVRGDYILHETVINLTEFSPSPYDSYSIKLTRDASDISDTFYGTVEVLDVVFDYVASSS